VVANEQFWARRIRWRLIGAWRWPLFFVCTIADAFIVHEFPPAGTRALFFAALFIASFGNLFLIGAVAPWLARRLAARQAAAAPESSFPPANHFELLVDKVASIVLVVATVGLLAAGLGNRKVVVADTDRLARAAQTVKEYVDVHAPPEIRRNIDTLNTHDTQEDGFFRMCVAYDERTKAYCMFVDAKTKPPTVVPDRDSRPNGAYFRTP
jgi:hypothetical protein